MTALMGVVLVLVLVLVAGTVLAVGEASPRLRLVFSVITGALGREALLRAWQGRPSWISRLGPLLVGQPSGVK